MKIALVVNLKNAKAGEVSDTLISEFQKEGADVLMLSEAKDISAKHNITYYETYEELFIACDIAVIAGGDGTIMHSARYAAIYSKSIIGVNLGRVGFVAELTPEDTQE
ncbi:MAG: NAD(+)/NADH kinase, partial [Oscillospiraceae bacterium]|nr:NAD(+)/NADH kinase [Oscillospiraceae bacterium]